MGRATKKRMLLTSWAVSLALAAGACGSDDRGMLVELRSYEAPCAGPEGAITAPLPGELGHWAAAGLRNDGPPLDIVLVDYGLTAADFRPFVLCETDVPHRVAVFSSNDDPPADPTRLPNYREVSVAPEGPSDESRTVEVAIDPPLRLETGERLYVAIEMTGELDDETTVGMCLATCSVEGRDTDDRWWSFARAAPFEWQTIDDEAVDDDHVVSAYGRPAQ